MEQYRLSQYNFPNITVEECYEEATPNVVDRYRVTPNVGYVMYDTNDETYILDPETNDPVRVTYYYRIAYLIPRYNFANFSWVAIPENEVLVDHISGN